jgi:hypothetical protein
MRLPSAPFVKTDFQIVPFTTEYIPEVVAFTDLQIGKNYYSVAEMTKNQRQSVAESGEITSFLLLDSLNQIQGLRLAYPAGHWGHGKGNRLRPDLWPFPLEKSAYFQSLFMSESARGFGFGPELSRKSLDLFRQLGNQGVITHCWKESPGNTSFKYLSKFGFMSIIEHPLYWVDVDYVCTRDGKPCRCTAIEMSYQL